MAEHESYLGLYRSGLSTPEHRRKVTVARQETLDDVLAHLEKSSSRRSKHHLLFIGARGIGKSHLLSLVEDGIAERPELKASCVVARFPEESHRTLSFADFLLGLCELLRDKQPDEPVWGELYAKLAEETDNDKIVDAIVPTIRRENRGKGRTVVVMLENLHELFRQLRSRKESTPKGKTANLTDVAALRKFFMDDNGCLLIATSPTHFDAITDNKEPFFDFFDTQYLESLDKEQAIELIRLNLEWDKRQDLLATFNELRPKLMALHDMTGGSPRLTLLLYELIVRDSVVQVRRELLQLLDKITPFYQHRMDDLAPQERAALETIATMRDGAPPKTPANIAARLRVSPQQASALLKRLVDARYLKSEENPADKRSRLYMIREGFFDIWLAMNLSRRERGRLPVLVEWFAKFYSQWEERERKRREYRDEWESENAREGLALLSDVGTDDERARAKLELARLHARDGRDEVTAEFVAEARRLRLDPMGSWIVERAEQAPATNYLDEIEEMIECWTRHRSGDLEGFVEKLAELGEGLTLRTFSEAKLAFLREHLALVNDVRERVRLRLRSGGLLDEMARWREAEVDIRRALEEAEAIPDQSLVANCLNELGRLLLHTNRLAEAEPLMKRALDIGERAYGPEHPTVSICLNNLARLLQDTNRLAEAERLIKRALAIDEPAYGPEHPTVAIRLSNLAQLLQDTSRLAEAEPLMKRALAIGERAYGPEHPTVAIRLSNLAQLLQETNRLAEAEPLMKRALAIGERAYGPEHPTVAIRLNNLARLLQETNRLAEAEPLMKRALDIDERAYGPNHPTVAIRLNNLAQLLQDTNRLAEAEPLMRRSVEILQQFRRANGFEHPGWKTALNNYSEMLKAFGLTEQEVEERLQSVTEGNVAT